MFRLSDKELVDLLDYCIGNYQLTQTPEASLFLANLSTSGVCMHCVGPFFAKDIQLLEKVQKCAAKVCTKQWNWSYEELLHTIQLATHTTSEMQDNETGFAL